GALIHGPEGYPGGGHYPLGAMRRVHTTLTLVAAALALGGCTPQQQSSSGDFQGAEREVAEVVDDLASAGRKGDAEEICTRILSRDLAAELEAGRSDCIDQMTKTIQDVNDFDLEVRDVAITGTTARAQVRQGDDGPTATFEFAREGGGWRATSLAAAS
ncbi:MAG: hypothetical protein ACRDK0_07480, partial [Solirubrobacteraceae bacterium]